jgi:hypothetical protein
MMIACYGIQGMRSGLTVPANGRPLGVVAL